MNMDISHLQSASNLVHLSVLCDSLGMGRKQAVYGHRANDRSVIAADLLRCGIPD